MFVKGLYVFALIAFFHAEVEHGAEFFTRKAAFFANALAGGPAREPASIASTPRWPPKCSLHSSGVQGSLELTSRQFDAWCDYLLRV